MRRALWVGLGLLSVLPAYAAGDPEAGAALVLKGNTRGAAACVACHGAKGEGNADAGYPHLAGLRADYLVHQLKSFTDGSRRQQVMTPIAKALSEQEAADVSAYYAQLPWTPTPPDPKQVQSVRGAKLAHDGVWEKDLPACFSCHGPHGEGVGPFPRIAGQHEKYLLAQLQAWRKGTRRNDKLHLMKASAEKLGVQDLGIVAAYIANYRPQKAASAAAPAPGSAKPTAAKPAPPPQTHKPFTPPPESEIPNDGFGEMVRLGKNIFVDTQTFAKQYTGNGLNCVNCHLDSGRKADSAPMWGAYVLYPAFRTKNEKVNTMQERIQGCFRFSQNGTVPPPDSKEVTALVSYFFWLAKGAPTGVELPGRGYPDVPKPKQEPDPARGAKVFADNCAYCHGANGQGQKAGARYAFPPLWGADSFNGGAGMSRVETAVGFIKANMPLGRGNTLSDQDAWDVSAFMNSHERPPDPRKQALPAGSNDKNK